MSFHHLPVSLKGDVEPRNESGFLGSPYIKLSEPWHSGGLLQSALEPLMFYLEALMAVSVSLACLH